jgi:hypothetical protein
MRPALFVLVLALACDRNDAATPAKGVEPSTATKAPESKTPAADTKTPDTNTVATKPVVPDGPVTAQTLLAFVPETLGGARAEYRQVADEALVAAAYRTPTGFINVNLALTPHIESDRLQVKGAESDEVVRNEGAGLEKRGVLVGSRRALFVRFLSGNQVELSMFIEDRINVRVSREGTATPEELVALMKELDLDGLAAIAPRVPAPPPI